MKNVFKTHALLLGLAMSCFGFTAAQAAVKTYVGPDGGSWVTGSNWSPAGVPTSADDVVSVGSPSTTILVDYNDLISFNSLTLTSTTLQLKGFIDDGVNITLEAGGIIAQQNDNEPNFNLNQMQTITGDLVIKAGGLLTLDDQGYPPDNQVFFRANNIDIRLNGAVDVSGKGYFGGGTAQRGEGPGAGAGSTGTSQGAGGAGNGGAGGNGLYGALGGGSYCDFSNPRAGSGGGGGPSASNPARGGGLLRLWAINNLNVDGRILANGEAGFAGTDAGGSSGGGIIVQAKTITGSPQAVEANGGSGDTTGGGGAGGCVSFRYSQSTSFSLPSVDVLGGVGAGGAANGSVGQKYYQLSPSSLDYFTVSGVGTTTITTTFGWGGGTETAYSLEQSTDGVNFTQVGLGPTTTAEFGFSNLLAGSYYWLRVGAISPVTGTSTYLMANKVYLPIIPTPITITGVSPTSIGLTFALGLNNPSTTLYNVRLLYPGSYLEFFANGQPALPAATNLNGSQTYLPSQWAGTAYGLTPSTTYDTRIMATDVQYYTAFVGGSTTTLLATPSTPT
jgi:hypothetical protein